VLVGALAHGNVIATGEAGSGKSVVLLDAAERLRETGATVVYLSAEADLPTLTTGSIEAVLDAWAEPGRPAYLFIDAMDALRLGNEVRRLRRLIEALARGVAATWAVAVFLANIDSQQRAA
jgi:KaiC/GvpD/RAD55 family RecA-like ATPase